jgi:pimeloyl-ACP methyl ester carboxylesterase
MNPTWRRIRRIWITAGITFTIVFSGWMLLGFRARGVDDAIFRSDGRIRVALDSETILFAPARSPSTAGLVFFPGGLVDPRAYGPLARQVAERGYLSIIVKLPFRTAWLDFLEVETIERALSAMQHHPEIQKWTIAGHSKGGMLAARFARDHAEVMNALVLIGTTGPKDFDLSRLQMPVTKVYATNDGVATVEGVRRTASLLPPDTRWVEIHGGNHAQFGWYGKQFGDGTATLSREDQQAQTLQAILDSMKMMQP